jgi:transcriptional regulator with XRE-family HTH domain
MADRTSDDEIKRSFGDSVRKARTTLGLSQEELADEAGLDRTYIGSVERGRRNVGLVNIKRIAEALNANVRDLF